jgi:hypothetical protein
MSRKPSKPDPIFAAIARHRAALIEYDKLSAAEEKLHDHPAERFPPARIGDRTFNWNCPRDASDVVDAARTDLIRRFGKKLAAGLEKPLEGINKALHKAYWDATAVQRRARKKAGIIALRKRMWAAHGLAERARHYLCRTKPRSVAGAAALVEHVGWVYDRKEESKTGSLVLRFEAQEWLAVIARDLHDLKKRSAP